MNTGRFHFSFLCAPGILCVSTCAAEPQPKQNNRFVLFDDLP